jgi:hypothetical protein
MRLCFLFCTNGARLPCPLLFSLSDYAVEHREEDASTAQFAHVLCLKRRAQLLW